MSLDPELELWRKEWANTLDSPPPPLPERVLASAIREQRKSHLSLAANIAFAIILLTGSFVTATTMGSREIVMWAVCVWMTTLIAAYLAFEAWRRSRLTTIRSVSDYSRFHRKRAIADQWSVRAGLVLLCIQVAIAFVWLTADLIAQRIRLFRFGLAMSVLVIVTVSWLYFFRKVWRRSAAVLETTAVEGETAAETESELRNSGQ